MNVGTQYGTNPCCERNRRAIINGSTGYMPNFGIGEYVLLLLARPRLNWIIMFIFADKMKNTAEIKPEPSDLLYTAGSSLKTSAISHNDTSSSRTGV